MNKDQNKYNHTFTNAITGEVLSEADFEIQEKVLEMQTDLLVLARMLFISGKKEFTINLGYAEAKFKIN